jgi:hypothetical protein
MDVKFKEIKYDKKINNTNILPKKIPEKIEDISLLDEYLRKFVYSNKPTKINEKKKIIKNKIHPPKEIKNDNELKTSNFVLKNSLPEASKKSTLKKDLMIKKLLEKKNKKSNSLTNLPTNSDMLSNLQNIKTNKKFYFESPSNIFFKFEKNETPYKFSNDSALLKSISGTDYELQKSNFLMNFHMSTTNEYLNNYKKKKRKLEKLSERLNPNIVEKLKSSSKNSENKYHLYDEYNTMNRLNIQLVDEKYKTVLNKNKNWKNIEKYNSIDQVESNHEEEPCENDIEMEINENDEELENDPPLKSRYKKKRRHSKNLSVINFETSILNSILPAMENKKLTNSSLKRKISCPKFETNNIKNSILSGNNSKLDLVICSFAKNELRGKILKPIDASKLKGKSPKNSPSDKDDKSKNISQIYNNINNIFIKKSLARSVISRNLEKENGHLKKSFSNSDEDNDDKYEYFIIHNKKFNQFQSTGLNTEINKNSTIGNFLSDNQSTILNQVRVNFINDKKTIISKVGD